MCVVCHTYRECPCGKFVICDYRVYLKTTQHKLLTLNVYCYITVNVQGPVKLIMSQHLLGFQPCPETVSKWRPTGSQRPWRGSVMLRQLLSRL